MNYKHKTTGNILDYTIREYKDIDIPEKTDGKRYKIVKAWEGGFLRDQIMYETDIMVIVGDKEFNFIFDRAWFDDVYEVVKDENNTD